MSKTNVKKMFTRMKQSGMITELILPAIPVLVTLVILREWLG